MLAKQKKKKKKQMQEPKENTSKKSTWNFNINFFVLLSKTLSTKALLSKSGSYTITAKLACHIINKTEGKQITNYAPSVTTNFEIYEHPIHRNPFYCNKTNKTFHICPARDAYSFKL